MKNNLRLSTKDFVNHFLRSYGTLEEFKYNSGFFYKKYITKDDIFFEPKLSFLYQQKEEKVVVEDFFDNVKDFRPFCDDDLTTNGRRDRLSRIIRREVKKQIKKNNKKNKMIMNANKKK